MISLVIRPTDSMMLNTPITNLLLLVQLLISSCRLSNQAAGPLDENPYFNLNLDPNDKLHLFWKVGNLHAFKLHNLLDERINKLCFQVHYELKKLEIEIRANLEEDQWMAVGFSDYGEMNNADICIYWTDELGITHFQVCCISMINPQGILNSSLKRGNRKMYDYLRNYLNGCKHPRKTHITRQHNAIETAIPRPKRLLTAFYDHRSNLSNPVDQFHLERI